jgi:AcrR family transcriptional regulator
MLDAAAVVIRARGYQVATLEDIAEAVGVTRAAVLHYFTSKDALLCELVTPIFTEVDRLLDEVEARGGPPTPHQQRAMVSAMVDIACDRRAVATIVFGDITARDCLPPHLQVADRAARLAASISAETSDPGHAVRVLAAIGAVLRPISAPDDVVDLHDPDQRQVLVDCALAALRSRPRSARTQPAPVDEARVPVPA